MYYNGENRYDVNEFLGLVHKDLRLKYSYQKKVESDNLKAQCMEQFFQKLKNYFLNKPDSAITDLDQAFFSQIANELPIIKREKRLFSRSNMFNYNGFNPVQAGEKFEQEIANVINIIATGKSGAKGVTEVQTGKTTYGGDQDLQDFINRRAKKLVFKISENDSSKEILDITNSIFNISKEYYEYMIPRTWRNTYDQDKQKTGRELYISNTQIKVDINGQKIEFSKQWNAEPSTQAAIDLIKSSTFTLKNYKKGHVIKLGNTNPIKAYFSILSDFGYDYKTKSSSFLHGLNLYNSKKPTATQARKDKYATYIYQMRFIYELTGIGQGKGSDLQDITSAQYLLYNEANGNRIKVIPTSQIIADMYANITSKQSFYRDNPFQGAMSIKMDWDTLKR